MTARTVTALVRTAPQPRGREKSGPDDGIRTLCPEVGFFRAHVVVGDLVRPGGVLGELEVLGSVARVVAPEGARGFVTSVAAMGAAVDYGAVLVVLDPSAAVAAGEVAAIAVSAAVRGLVFRAPTSGRFYGRPSPDKPAFVEAGSDLAAGTTICLLEVMKTFHRVTYAVTGGLPDRARVVAVLVADGADVNAGEPLLSLA